jgi:rod shape determining protein RodA
VLKQSDLGTATMLFLGGTAVFFAAGVPLWIFAMAAGIGAGAMPIAWEMLHD